MLQRLSEIVGKISLPEVKSIAAGLVVLAGTQLMSSTLKAEAPETVVIDGHEYINGGLIKAETQRSHYYHTGIPPFDESVFEFRNIWLNTYDVNTDARNIEYKASKKATPADDKTILASMGVLLENQENSNAPAISVRTAADKAIIKILKTLPSPLKEAEASRLVRNTSLDKMMVDTQQGEVSRNTSYSQGIVHANSKLWAGWNSGNYRRINISGSQNGSIYIYEGDGIQPNLSSQQKVAVASMPVSTNLAIFDLVKNTAKAKPLTLSQENQDELAEGLETLRAQTKDRKTLGALYTEAQILSVLALSDSTGHKDVWLKQLNAIGRINAEISQEHTLPALQNTIQATSNTGMLASVIPVMREVSTMSQLYESSAANLGTQSQPSPALTAKTPQPKLDKDIKH